MTVSESWWKPENGKPRRDIGAFGEIAPRVNLKLKRLTGERPSVGDVGRVPDPASDSCVDGDDYFPQPVASRENVTEEEVFRE